jgi:hypothetical protein
MKIHGKKLSGPNVEVVVLPRSDGDLVFRAQAVLDYSDFEKLNPAPQPPVKLLRGGVTSQNVEDPSYKKAIDKWVNRRTAYMILKSLEATEGLEWETVDIGDPTSWENYSTEMKEAGLSDPEMAAIVETVTTANGLNQDKIEEATQRFLAGQAQERVAASSQSSEQKNTSSGEPASASA